MAAGLVGGEGFAVDASVIEADASRFQRVEGAEVGCYAPAASSVIADAWSRNRVPSKTDQGSASAHSNSLISSIKGRPGLRNEPLSDVFRSEAPMSHVGQKRTPSALPIYVCYWG